MFSTEESHGIERITQEIKGLDDEKEGTQKLATPKDQEATITLKWEGLRVRVPYERSGPWQTIGKLELELQRDTVAARNVTAAARRKTIFFSPLFFKIFIGVWLLYNVAFVSGVQKSESAILKHVSPLFWISFPFRSPQITE